MFYKKQALPRKPLKLLVCANTIGKPSGLSPVRYTVKEQLAYLFKTNPQAAPAEKFMYSNAGFFWNKIVVCRFLLHSVCFRSNFTLIRY
jgi:hypothetical protein